jgi:hypothetical protein
MKTEGSMNAHDETWAVFWCSLLAPVLFGEVPAKESGRFLRSLAEKECTFPDGRRKKPSLSTLRRKLKLYRQRGFEALAKRPRSDRGRSRKYPPAMLARAVELKKEQPRRSQETINQFLRQEFGRTIPPSTLYRHLKAAGARVLVVLDEAHLLDADSLTDLRLLVSSALDDTPPLKLLLVGQHALAQTLRQTVLRDLLDRITVRYHLHPLDREQTAAYLDFQMKQAGGTGKEFDATSKSLIHDYTGGVPRQVNNLATACLLAAAAANTHHVTEGVLQQTLNEFQLP